MNPRIAVEDKKIFIKWLLKSHKMKNHKCDGMLNYLLTHDEALNRVRFMEEAHYCQRAMEMSATDSESIPFRFYIGNLMTADTEKSFQDMKINPDKELCIQINFLGKYESAEYLAVLEENEYLPEYLKKLNAKLSEDVSEDIESLVSVIIARSNRHVLINEIDRALDCGDKELFMQLSEMLIKQDGIREVSFSA